jgi:hypothetical protein
MINKEFFDWLTRLSDSKNFAHTTPLSETAKSQGKATELVLRFLSYQQYLYTPGIDVNEYLDASAKELAKIPNSELIGMEKTFSMTFKILDECLGEDAFKRWNGSRHAGSFLISLFEVVSHGAAWNLDRILAKDSRNS